MEAVSRVTGRVGAARPRRRRHRPDHPEAVPEAHRAHRLREFLFYDWRERAGDFRAQPARVRGRHDPASPAANFGCGSSREHAAVGAARTTASRPSIAPSFARHLPLERGPDGLAARRAARPRQVKALMEAVDLDRGSELVGRPRDAQVTTPAGKVGSRSSSTVDARSAAQRPRRHRADAAARGRDHGVRDGPLDQMTALSDPPHAENLVSKCHKVGVREHGAAA